MKQTQYYDCGPTALQSVFLYYGIEMRLDELLAELNTQEEGTHPTKMIAALKAHGLEPTEGHFSIPDLRDYITKDMPVILLLQAWAGRPNVDWATDYADGHYVVAIGYDDERVIFEDPWVYHRTYLPYKELETRWHDLVHRSNEREIHYGIAVGGKQPAFYPETIIKMQ